jgi:hypothetical protein
MTDPAAKPPIAMLAPPDLPAIAEGGGDVTKSNKMQRFQIPYAARKISGQDQLDGQYAARDPVHPANLVPSTPDPIPNLASFSK